VVKNGSSGCKIKVGLIAEMAKILFGLSGDGRGHSTRSKATIEHLIEKGHDLRIVASGKGYEYLSNYFSVARILGFRIVNQGGEVSIWGTVRESSLNLLKHGLLTLKRLLREVDNFRPDLTISDFEPIVSTISGLKRIPLISIDNQHMITLCKLECPKDWGRDYLIARAVCAGISSFAEHFFITSFFVPELKRGIHKKVTIVGSVLRKEVLQQVPKIENHILVYIRTPERAKEISSLIKRLEAEVFLVYGSNGVETKVKNITFKKLSTEEFLKDLASSKAIITNGGHSLISEALYLGKPIYSIPTKRDFEQMINGYYVERLGYGLYGLSPSAERMQAFLENLKYFKANIKRDRERSEEHT
jgi:uncharacterized protein (TIGR00661 family)